MGRFIVHARKEYETDCDSEEEAREEFESLCSIDKGSMAEVWMVEDLTDYSQEDEVNTDKQ